MRKIKIYGEKSPHPWQLDVHNYISSYLSSDDRAAETIVIKAARQRFGKSTFSKAELIRFALGRQKSVNAYVTPKLNLARKMFKEIVAATSDFISAKNMIDMIIEYNNGSTIRFHSEQQGEGLRGFTITGVLIIDEASSYKDDTFYELIAPWVTVHKALTIMISTPKWRSGFFYNHYIDGMNPDKEYVKTFDWVRDYDVPIPPEDEEKRGKMPAMKWRSEYLGLFLDAEGSVFGSFEDCLITGEAPEFEELYFGLDFGTGSGSDYTVLTALNENMEQVFLWTTNNLPPTEQTQHIADIIAGFGKKVNGIMAEKNSIGNIYLNMLSDKGVSTSPFVTTNDSKRKLVERLQVVIEQKQIRLLNNDQQSLELSFFESKVNPSTNLVTYNAAGNRHDDMVMGLMLALHCYDTLKGAGNYHFTFI